MLYTSQASAASSFPKLPTVLPHASLGWLSSRNRCTPYVPVSNWSRHDPRPASFSVRRHTYLRSRYKMRSKVGAHGWERTVWAEDFHQICLAEHSAALLSLTVGRCQDPLTRAQNLNSLGSLPLPA